MVLAIAWIAGCKPDATDFFNGRPSGLSQLHNSILSNPDDGLFELLRIPGRYADATDEQVAQWQLSLVAWWRVPEQKLRIQALMGRLDRSDMVVLRAWILKNRTHMPLADARDLDDMSRAMAPVHE